MGVALAVEARRTAAHSIARLARREFRAWPPIAESFRVAMVRMSPGVSGRNNGGAGPRGQNLKIFEMQDRNARRRLPSYFQIQNVAQFRRKRSYRERLL